jgi:hypothetical protein
MILSMRMRVSYLSVAFLSAALPATAGLIPASFSGPAFQVPGYTLSDWQVDLSGLVLTDLADGMKFSGIVTATYIGLGGFSGGLASVAAFRPLVGNTATPIAQVSATVTTSGGIAFADLENRTGISLEDSGTYCSTNVASSSITTFFGGDGFYSSPAHTGGECTNPLYNLYLFQTLTFGAVAPAPGGTVTFDLGNSSNSQATSPAAAVPEPSTFALLASIGFVSLFAKRRLRR